MTKAPLCSILMPFGAKANPDGSKIDFDRVYQDLIAPDVRDAEPEPIRAHHEGTGGIIHKPMFERLILCPFAVADLTTANANVYYELGVRHAFKPFSTVQIIAEASGLSFDVQMLRETRGLAAIRLRSKPMWNRRWAVLQANQSGF